MALKKLLSLSLRNKTCDAFPLADRLSLVPHKDKHDACNSNVSHGAAMRRPTTAIN